MKVRLGDRHKEFGEPTIAFVAVEAKVDLVFGPVVRY